MGYVTVESANGGLRREFEPHVELTYAVEDAIAAIRSGDWFEYYRRQHAFLWTVIRSGRVPPDRRAWCFRTLDRLERLTREALLREL